MMRRLSCVFPGARLLAALLIVSAMARGQALGRVFTNTKGKTIEAEMVGASKTHVRLKKDGRVFNVPIETLSDTDQHFIRMALEETKRKQILQQRIAAIRNAGSQKKPEEAEDVADSPTFDSGNTDFVGGGEDGGAEKPETAQKPDQPEKPKDPAEAAKPPPKKPPAKKPPAKKDPNKPGVPGKVTTEKIEVEKDVVVSYYLYLPKDFTRDRKWPLMIILASGSHGQRAYINQYLKGVEKNGFVLVMPIYEREPKLETVETDRYVAETVIEKVGIDPDRVYLTGLSSAADRAFKCETDLPKLDIAGILSCDAGLSQTRTKLDKKTVLYATCGAGSKRRYDLGYTFDSLLKGKDHRLRFFMGSNTWPTEELLTEGVTWLNICFLRKVSPRDKALVAERKALATKLFTEAKEEMETAPDRAYEKALMLEALSEDTVVSRVLPPVLKMLGQKPEIKQYIEAKKEMDRFVGKYFGQDPRKVDLKEEDKSAKRSAERLAEKYKDTSLAPLFSRMGDMPL